MERPKVYRSNKSYKPSSKQYHWQSRIIRSKKVSYRDSKISWYIKWLLVLLGASIIFIITVTIYILLSTPDSGSVNSVPVAQINLTSEPAGASVFLAGKDKGKTPLSLNLPVGIHSIEFRKNGYGSYFNRIEITAQSNSSNEITSQSIITVTPSTAGAGLPAVSSNQTRPNILFKATKPLPSYSLNARLRSDRLVMQPLPQPFPEARLEYARFLNSQVIELTYLNKEGQPLLPGSEGLPTNLWLYNPHSGSHPSPVLLTYATWHSLANYYGIEVGEAAESSNNWLSQIAVTNPVVSPEGGRLAFVSNALPLNSISPLKVKESTGATSPLPIWDDQAVWISPLSSTLSSGGATLAGADASLGPQKLFSLANLLQLLPGMSPLSNGTNTYSTAQRFATIKGINWSPDGNALLAVIEINEASLTGSRSSTGSASPVSIMGLAVVGDGTSPGRLTLVTPQPLTEQILPGTLNWSADGSAVSFLVSQDQYTGGTQTQAGLCVLDLGNASRLNNYVSETQTIRNTPLHYLAQVKQTGAWNTSGTYRSSTQAGGRVYPPAYGSFRYSPFAWPVSAAENNQAGEGLSLTELSKKGLYSAAGQTGSTSIYSLVSLSNLYTYYREDQTIHPVVDELTNSKIGSGRNDTITNPKPVQNQGKTGSYPFWLAGQNSFYFATRQTVIDSNKEDQGGFFGSSSSVQVWQLLIDSLSFPSEVSQNGPGSVTSAAGVSVRLIEDRPGPVTLSLSTSADRPIPGLAPGRFEAQWRPDGLAALVALSTPPSGPANQGNQVWLVSWDKD